MSVEALQSIHALAFGFAVAGLLASFYQAITNRPVSFNLLIGEPQTRAVMAVPLLILTAPFIIMRNTIRGHVIQDRKLEIVMLATIFASLWSLMSGTFVLMVLNLCGMPAA